MDIQTLVKDIIEMTTSIDVFVSMHISHVKTPMERPQQIYNGIYLLTNKGFDPCIHYYLVDEFCE